MFWTMQHKGVTNFVYDCICTVEEGLQLSGRVCLSHSAARAIYTSWLQTLLSAHSTRSDNTTDNV